VIQVVFEYPASGQRHGPKVPRFSRSRLITDIMATYEARSMSRVMTGDLLSKITQATEALRDMFYLVHHHIGRYYHPPVRLVTSTGCIHRLRLAGIVVWCIINWRFYTVWTLRWTRNNLKTTFMKRLKMCYRTCCHLCNKKDIEREEIEKFQYV
jgi:hypothetical protein